MADDELAAIRARRMAELQQQQHGGDDRMKAQEEQKAREAEMANVLLGQCLEQAARTRLNTIALTKPEKAKMVESYIIQMAKSGQLQGQKLSEKALIGLLEQVSSSTQKTTTVKFDRRRAALDSDDDIVQSVREDRAESKDFSMPSWELGPYTLLNQEIQAMRVSVAV